MPHDPTVPTGPLPGDPPEDDAHHHRGPRQIFLHGLAITLPSILTVVILLWFGGVVYRYLVYPVSTMVRYAAAEFIDESVPRDELARYQHFPEIGFGESQYLLLTEAKKQTLTTRRQEAIQAGNLNSEDPVPWEWIAGSNERFEGVYYRLSRRAVPYFDYVEVAQSVVPSQMPYTARGVYMELVTIRYFGSTFTLSTLAVLIAILAIYFVGRLVRIRLGHYLVTKFETDVLGRLPLISNVYGSVKQVTDFLFTERKVEYNRVVAVEYPRRGIWTVGFATGNGMRQAVDVAGRPLVNILIPTSPMPFTGFTISVPKGEIIDLEISLDQAFQYIISCGVLIPPQQLTRAEQREYVREQVEDDKELISTSTNTSSEHG